MNSNANNASMLKPELKPETGKKAKKEKPKLKAENSIALRIVAALMAFLCIIVAAIYTQMHPVWALFYVWVAMIGSYLSYNFRDKRIHWMSWLITAGLIGVMANFALEIYMEFRIGRIEGLIPFIHVLIGLMTLQTFDLETRNDINISVLIALGLFTCAAVIGTDLKFGFFVFLLVMLGTLMLYFEAISRTRSNESAEQTATPPTVYTATTRAASGVGVLPILSIPALSFVFFLLLPRVDSVFDAVIAYLHASNRNQLKLSYLPGPDNDNAAKGQIKDKNGKVSNFSHVDNPLGLAVKSGGVSTGANNRSPGSNSTGSAGSVPGKSAGSANGASGSAGGVGDKSGKTGAAGATADGKKKAGAGSTNVGSADGKSEQGDKNGAKKDAKAPPTGPGNGKFEFKESDELVFRNEQAVGADDQLLLYVGCDETVYLRRMYFDKFDGHHWTVSNHSNVADCEKLGGNYAELGGVPALHVSAKLKTKEVVQRIVVMNSIGHILPTADIPQSVAIGDEKITVDDFGVIRCKSELKEITNYEVISKVPVLDLDALRRMSTPDPSQMFKKEFQNYLQLPEDMPVAIEAEAQRVSQNDGNWFVKAERINQYLKKSYKYSTQPFVDNPKQDLVSDFLFNKKEGACGQFASSFAVLCRSVGIPTRLVGGFAPGEYDSQKDRREVRAKDGHSWAEIYIPDAGWIPFDPTPSGTLPVPPENVNPIAAAIDRSLKDVASNFSAQQLDRQFSHGKDENYPVSTEEAKTHGLKGPIKDVTTPQLNLAKDLLGGHKGAKKAGVNAPNDALQNEETKGFKFEDSTLGPKGRQSVPWVNILLILCLLIFTGLVAAAYFFRAHLRRFIFRSEFPRVTKGVKPSTLVFLKLSDDLRRLKILRRPSDTAEDLGKRFFDAFSDEQPCHPELPSLFGEFMELYLSDRFGTDDNSVENYRQLRDLGTRIHTLARTRFVDKAS